MKHSDAFKLSTLATAIVAIMPALANAAEAADTPANIQKTQIINGKQDNWTDKGVAGVTDTPANATTKTPASRKDERKVAIVNAGTTDDPEELKYILQAGANSAHLDTSASKGVTGVYSLGGIYVGKDDTNNPVTATYTGGNADMVVNVINKGSVVSGDNFTSIKIAAAAVSGESAGVRSTLTLGGEKYDKDITLKATNNALMPTALGLEADAGGKSVVKTSGNVTIGAAAQAINVDTDGNVGSSTEGNAYAVHAYDRGYVDIDAGGKFTATAKAQTAFQPDATTPNGKAVALYAEGDKSGNGDFEDHDNPLKSELGINVEADTIVLEAEASGGISNKGGSTKATKGDASAVWAVGGKPVRNFV